MPEPAQIRALNTIRRALHEAGPFRAEPVDLVEWVDAETVVANDYNPNSVAPPEMRLLEHSIRCDGYTQPIVTHQIGACREVVDGFHRNRVGKECREVRERVRGYLPVVRINAEREDHNDRVASTIRHNRARGKHLVDGMSDIVADLARRNWSDQKIAKELGMDPDEVLRLKQITGLAELFADREFSEAWEVAFD
jgi:ParB-like chromosome segregation protein Spo0J